jgi:uncharacterized protein YciI
MRTPRTIIGIIAAIGLAVAGTRMTIRALPEESMSEGPAPQASANETHSLVRLTPGRERLLETLTPAEREIVDRHFDYLVGLRNRGIVVHAGRTTDPLRLWGIVIMRASVSDAERLMAEDPAIRAGIQVSEVFPYSVAIERK